MGSTNKKRIYIDELSKLKEMVDEYGIGILSRKNIIDILNMCSDALELAKHYENCAYIDDYDTNAKDFLKKYNKKSQR